MAELEKAKALGLTFPLILLDAQLPGEDAFEIANQIKKNPALGDCKIVMLTSIGWRGDAAKCRAIGISAYLTKPIKRAGLLEVINLVLAPNHSASAVQALITMHSLRENRTAVNRQGDEEIEVKQILAPPSMENATATQSSR